MRRSPLRPSLSPSLLNQKIIDLPSTFHRRNKPTRSCATTCPSFTRGTSIFRRDLPAFQNASSASNNPCSANYGNGPHPLQLFLKLRTTLNQHFVNPLSQVLSASTVIPDRFTFAIVISGAKTV
jgi:hypothetical protein